jgi:3',5'-cyclic AMP phosphodiesterase CpdA
MAPAAMLLNAALLTALAQQPDFIVFTGDLTHTTDDGKERRARMKRFREIVGALSVKDVRFMPGEHDASLDKGEAFKEFFGATHYTFDHKGVHFIVIDNVSDPTGAIGDEQMDWLRADLAKLKPDANIVVFTHRPLFDLAPKWDWATRDGAQAIEMLMPYENVTVFYGHIHHEHHTTANGVVHHATQSLMIPLFPAGTRAERTMVPWDSKRPYAGMGWRTVSARGRGAAWEVNPQGVV